MACQQHCVHGDCQQGSCNCDPDWAGNDCSVNVTEGISLISIKGKDKCDVAKQKCTSFVIDADNVVAGPNLKCRFERQLRNLSWEVEVETTAYLLAGSDLHCHLPEKFAQTVGLNRTASRHYRVSATNGVGSNFDYSNSLPITIHHSHCHHGNKNVCIIDDKCLMDQFQNPDVAWEVCDVTMSTVWWSIPTETTVDVSNNNTVNCRLTGPGLEHAGDKEISWLMPTRLNPHQTFELHKETWNSTQVDKVLVLKDHVTHHHYHHMMMDYIRQHTSQITCEVIQIWPKKSVV